MVKRLLLIMTVLVTGLIIPGTALAANSQLFDQACQDSNAASSPTCGDAAKQEGSGTNPVAGPGGVLNTVTSVIALVGGIAAVVVIVVGAFNYSTAGGNAENAAKARRRILGAAIGLAVIMLAWALIRFVTDKIIK